MKFIFYVLRPLRRGVFFVFLLCFNRPVPDGRRSSRVRVAALEQQSSDVRKTFCLPPVSHVFYDRGYCYIGASARLTHAVRLLAISEKAKGLKAAGFFPELRRAVIRRRMTLHRGDAATGCRRFLIKS